MEQQKNKFVKVWLWVGIVMVLVQFLLGSVTRLTESGLSITEWSVFTGIVYPYSEETWNHQFELYKKSPQYSKINEGMSLSDFKFIYFWEYFHRFWARLIGFVFLIPFIYFLWKKCLSKKLLVQLGILVCLGILEASIGWIMVQSGLMDRPWVDAYKLSFHLSFATVLLSYMYWIVWSYGNELQAYRTSNYKYLLILSLMFFIQIFLGGVMSGMRAGLVAPTWPDINGSLFPKELSLILVVKENLINTYEENHISSIIVQFAHRTWAYLIFLFTCFIIWKNRLNFQISLNNKILFFFTMLMIQIVFGICTVIYCIGSVPIALGVIHQIWGILSFLLCLDLFFENSYKLKVDK